MKNLMKMSIAVLILSLTSACSVTSTKNKDYDIKNTETQNSNASIGYNCVAMFDEKGNPILKDGIAVETCANQAKGPGTVDLARIHESENNKDVGIAQANANAQVGVAQAEAHAAYLKYKADLSDRRKKARNQQSTVYSPQPLTGQADDDDSDDIANAVKTSTKK